MEPILPIKIKTFLKQQIEQAIKENAKDNLEILEKG